MYYSIYMHVWGGTCMYVWWVMYYKYVYVVGYVLQVCMCGGLCITCMHVHMHMYGCVWVGSCRCMYIILCIFVSTLECLNYRQVCTFEVVFVHLYNYLCFMHPCMSVGVYSKYVFVHVCVCVRACLLA